MIGPAFFQNQVDGASPAACLKPYVLCVCTLCAHTKGEDTTLKSEQYCEILKKHERQTAGLNFEMFFTFLFDIFWLENAL